MEPWKEKQQEDWAATFQPDADKDAQLNWGAQRINAELSPEERMALGRYKQQKEAFEQARRDRRVASYQAQK